MVANVHNGLGSGDARAQRAARRGVTLLELLLVVAIIAVLIAFLLPATRSARPAARRSQCVNNLKQIALGIFNYEREYHCLPPSYTVDARGRPLHSWRTLILPYIEQQSLYESIDLAKPWDDPANARARETAVLVYCCPEATEPRNTTTYLAIAGPNNCLRPGAPRALSEITDGTSSTLMVIEVGEEKAVPWMAPVDADERLVIDLGPASKLHGGNGANACLVDGSVHFLRADTPAGARRAMLSIAGHDDEAALAGK